MTDQNVGHPTLGRRRRHKSPSSLQNMPALPIPRLADHFDSENVPSDEEGGKEAKRQKSEPTTPTSTSSRPPNEYDEVMGITQVDSREAEKFEEGLDSEFYEATEEPPDTQAMRLTQDTCLFFPRRLRQCITPRVLELIERCQT